MNNGEPRDPERPILAQPLAQLEDVAIGDGTGIGNNVCSIRCTIGRNCVIGANSAITRRTPRTASRLTGGAADVVLHGVQAMTENRIGSVRSPTEIAHVA